MYGESAGGGLALATAVALRDAGEVLPLRPGLVAPWVDLTCSGDSYRTLPHVDPDITDQAEPPAWAAAYAGEATADPNASPLFVDGLWHQWHLQHHLAEALTAFDELAVFLTADLAERS